MSNCWAETENNGKFVMKGKFLRDFSPPKNDQLIQRVGLRTVSAIQEEISTIQPTFTCEYRLFLPRTGFAREPGEESQMLSVSICNTTRMQQALLSRIS